MKGLIIREPWIDYILSGKKVWEIRGSNTTIRGRIALIKSGTSTILGEANLINSIKLDLSKYYVNKDKHCIDNVDSLPYKNTYGWVLSDVKKYKTPEKYRHPKGAVIWVNL